MAFIENIGKRISQTSYDVVKKTRNQADINKCQGFIEEEQRHIDGLYLRIGEMYCEICMDAPNPELCKMVSEVKESLEKIVELRGQIARIAEKQEAESSESAESAGIYSQEPEWNESAIFCPVCGREASEEQRFCTNCGAKIPEKDSGKKCPQCGKILASDAMFCSECGATME